MRSLGSVAASQGRAGSSWKNSNSNQLEVPRGEPWLDQLGAPIKRHLNLEERQLFVISGLGPANG